ITRDASFRARDAFISPSAAITSSASAAIALCSWTGSFTSLISTRSTLMPQSSVASSRLDWKREKELTPVSYILCCCLHQPYLLWWDVK
uniref:Uncharacterized protein n=1 Tax=Seriola dumerili TaxID=41447 RepID=A0A3B4TD44_SERDU